MVRSPGTRCSHGRVLKLTLNRAQLPSISNGGTAANVVDESRVNRITVLRKGHKKVLSTGELFIRALTVQLDLSRRVLKDPGNKTLLKERQKHEKIVARLAREYKAAIAQYLEVVRAFAKQ